MVTNFTLPDKDYGTSFHAVISEELPKCDLSNRPASLVAAV